MAEPMNRGPDAIDEMAWLRKRVEALTPGRWRHYGIGGIAAANGDEVAAEYHATCPGCGDEASVIPLGFCDAASVVALRNLAPSMLAVIEVVARRHYAVTVVHEGHEDLSGCACGDLRCVVGASLEAFHAAVREECAR